MHRCFLRADIGIAMGALGSDAAIEAADIVLMDDDPLKISKAIRISRKCLRIVYENIYFAIGVKVVCLILGALGIAEYVGGDLRRCGRYDYRRAQCDPRPECEKSCKENGENHGRKKKNWKWDHCEETEVHEELLRDRTGKASKRRRAL